MRAAAANQGYLKYATGYPLTLTKTLAKPPESVAVYGAEGGVGDKTANLFNKNERPVRTQTITQVIPTDTGIIVRTTASGASSWVIYIIGKTADIAGKMITLRTANDTPIAGGEFMTCDAQGLNQANSQYYGKQTEARYTVPTSGYQEYVAFRFNALTTPSDTRIDDIRVYMGTSNLPYEPYGYKIPILISSGTENKTINLYSDTDLVDGEFLTVNPKAKTATLTDGTSVAALQDWTQDFAIPKADSLTVTAGTTVEPDKLGIAYMSKNKVWRIYGASGGVGDRTANLFDISTLNIGTPDSAESLTVENDTFSFTKKKTAVDSFVYVTIHLPAGTYMLAGSSSAEGQTTGFVVWSVSKRTFILNMASSGLNHTFTLDTEDNCQIRFYTAYRAPVGTVATFRNVRLNVGSSTLPYEPYGYKIPVLLTTSQDTDTVKIYADASLGDGDVLTVNPKQSAMRNDTDVSGLQDWSQDWKVPKGVTGVTVDTTVQPSKFEV